MRDSGCFMVYMGFESITQEGLDSYNKKQKVEHITSSIKLLHDYGIRVHGMFVVGSDMDTRETVRATVDFAVEHKIDTIQMMMLTTLPGTSFDTQMRTDGRVLTDDYSLYDGHHCIIAPKNMTPYELQMETWKGMLSFYSSQGWLSMFNRQIASNLGRIAKLLLHASGASPPACPRSWYSHPRPAPDAFKLLRNRLSPARRAEPCTTCSASPSSASTDAASCSSSATRRTR